MEYYLAIKKKKILLFTAAVPLDGPEKHYAK